MIEYKKQKPHLSAENTDSASWDSFGYYWCTVQVTAVVTSTHSADTVTDISKVASLQPSTLPKQMPKF
jgi:hypothetical protein